MRVALLAALLFAAPALAQDAGEKGYLVEDVASQRFADAEVPGPELKSGDEVVVLFREGERVRVRKGTGYGWVDADTVSPFPQGGPAASAPLVRPPSGEFDPAAIEALLERAKAP